MKNLLFRVLPVAILLGISACQNGSSDAATAAASPGVPLAFRFQAQGNQPLPEADSLHFYIQIEGRAKPVDTMVSWKRHELSLGVVPSGTAVTWQVKAFSTYRIVAGQADSQRVVPWTSDTLRTKVVDGGDGYAMTLLTPVQSKDSASDTFSHVNVKPDSSGKVPLKFADSVFVLTFGFPDGDRVKVTDGDRLLTPTLSGGYADTIKVPAGTSKKVRLT